MDLFSIVFLIGAYIVGSFPTGFLLALYTAKIDIRSVGSGTMGASNVARFLGKVSFVIVAFLDTMKAFLYLKFISLQAVFPFYWFLINGLFLVFGNIFSYGFRFPVGKGVSTTLGILLFFNHFFVIFFVGLWFFFLFIFQVPTIASLLSFLGLVIISFSYSSFSITLFLLLLLFLLLYSHRTFLKTFILKG